MPSRADAAFDPAAYPQFITDITDALVKRGGTWRDGEVWFCCLAHDEVTPSAHWNPERGTWHCFGCDRNGHAGGALALAKLLGIDAPNAKVKAPPAKPAVAMDPPKIADGPPIEYRYYARDGHGGHRHIATAFRQNFKGGGKRMWQGPAGSNGGEVKGLDVPLYNLPDLDAADSSQPVFFVEGEKCVERLRAANLLATTSIQGSNSWRSELAVQLAGRRVIILPDADAAGLKYARAVARDLVEVAAEVRIVELPGLVDKEDVYDWLERGNNPADLYRLAGKAKVIEKPLVRIDPLRVWSLADLLRNPPPAPPSLVGDGILYPGGFAMLAGQPGIGKSWVSFDLALSMTLATTWLDHAAFNCDRPIKTGMISMEMPIHFMAERFIALLRNRGLEKDAAIEMLNGAGPYLLASPPVKAVNLGDDDGRRFILDFVTRNELGMLILDPFSRLHWTDENDAREVGTILAAVDAIRNETGCAILLVHHTGKGKGGNDEGMVSARGSSRLLSDPQTILVLTKIKGQPTLKLEKANFAPPMDPIPLERLPYGGFTVGVTKITPEVKTRQWLIELLMRNPGGLAVADIIAAGNGSPGKSTVHRHLNALAGLGVVTVDKSGKADRYYYVG